MDLRSPKLPTPAGYAIAAAAVAVVAVLRYGLGEVGLLTEVPYIFFAVPTVIGAWIGGFGPGMFAGVLSALLVGGVFLAEGHISRGDRALSLVMFLLETALISAVGHARFRANEGLREARDHLEARVRERTSQLRAANEQLHSEAAEREASRQELAALASRLEISNRELEEFASVASHDLQEPLRKVQAFGDRLSSRYAEQLGAEGRDYLERMHKAAERMQALINDLLMFSRVTTKARPPEPVDLRRVAEEVLSDLEMALDRSGGRVEIGDLPTIEADPTQMRQLFQNLIGNALKFRRPDAAPVVRIDGRGIGPPEPGREEDRVELIFRDNGIGFDERYAERIFGVFQRLHGRGTYEGTGIGLAICRRIVERHGGEIVARSRPGEGSTFVVTLPAHQPGGETPDGH